MRKQPTLQPVSAEKQKQYERQARLQYGPDNVNVSVRRWASYSQAQKDAIQAEGGQVYTDLVEAMEAGQPAGSAEVEAILARWHRHTRFFYEPTLEILRGLGELYNTDPEFMAYFRQYHDDLPAYLQETIAHYVDTLETRELERMLLDDAARRLRA